MKRDGSLVGYGWVRGRVPDAAEDVRAQPYLMFDVDSLVQARLTADHVVDRLLDAIAARAAHPEATRRIATDGEQHVFTWFDERGVGFDGLLTPKEAHLMLTLLPHDAELEGAVLSAVLDLLGDELTRIRSQRTTRHRAEVIVG